ncbi:MAG: GNAT family N-acetyltransferase [Chloroflexi bacterium]|nr:GNAT family N-acetyltransferase [Chloroflexota bacterium]
MSLTITEFKEQHLEAAARLLAARQVADRCREPSLSAAFESPEALRPMLEQLFQRSKGNGAIALRDGEPVGYIIASPVLPAPTQLIAQFFPPRSMTVPYEGHATAAAEDASLYRDLYAFLAANWVGDGYFEHFVNVPAQDAAAGEAWNSLGFGRELTCAIREVDEPVIGVPASEQSGTEVHRAGVEDIAVIEALTDALWVHHTGSPILAPFMRDTQESERELSLELLKEPANAHFVAYRDGEPLALNSFMKPGFLPPLLPAEECTYLWQGIVYAHARGAGIGRTLLAHAMDWAKDAGYRWCVLHFYSANISGASFWLGNAFRPLEYRLRRHVDERIAWAGH